MLIGYVGSSDSNVTTTESNRPVNTQQAENSQSSAPTFSTANAGSMANYYGTLASMQSPAKLMALLNPTYYQQAPPSPNDPPGTILPGDLGDLSIEVNTQNGQQAVGINDLLNGNFQPAGLGQSPQQLGQNLVWQYLKGTARSDGWQVNNDYAGNSSAQRLDAVLRACDPQTAYKLLSGQIPDPANSATAQPGNPVNQQDVKDQQLLQSDFKQLVANGTFTAGDIREIVDAQSRQSYGSEGLTTANIDNLIKGLGNDPNSQAVRKAFADESIKDAKTAVNGQTSSQLWAQASDAVAGLGKTGALAYTQSLSQSDRSQLIGGALDGQAQQLQQPHPPNAPNSPMGSAAKLLEWAGQSAQGASAGAANTAQGKLAADLWAGAVDKFGTNGGSFSSNAQALLQADGKNGIGLRSAMADCYDGAFKTLLSRGLNENPNHLALGGDMSQKLQNFAQAELAYPPLGSANDVAKRIVAPMQQLIGDLQAYPTDPSKMSSDFGSMFGPGNQGETAALVAGQIFQTMRNGVTQDANQAAASNGDARGQADFGLQVIGDFGSLLPVVGQFANPLKDVVQGIVDNSFVDQANTQAGYENAISNAYGQMMSNLIGILPVGPLANNQKNLYIDQFSAGSGIANATAPA